MTVPAGRSRDGRQLYCCSSDGHVACISVTDVSELADPAPSGAKEAFLASHYKFHRPAVRMPMLLPILHGPNVFQPAMMMQQQGM